MPDPNRNREENRPFGEETPIPDHELSRNNDTAAELYTDGNYPDPADRSSYSCRGCRRAIPADRTRCGYCGTAHTQQRNTSDATTRSGLRHDGRDTSSIPRTPSDTQQWIWRRVTFAVVAARSGFAAIAKGTVATAYHLEAEDEIAKSRLVDAFVGDLPAVVTDTWGQLPAATKIDSSTGRRLVRQAIAGPVGETDPAHPEPGVRHAQADTRRATLYDETGSTIQSPSALAGIELGAPTAVWLVPAITYYSTTDRSAVDEATDRPQSSQATLSCHHCTHPTPHGFTGYDDGPYTTGPGQPVWQCRTCNAYRFGPVPDSAPNGNDTHTEWRSHEGHPDEQSPDGDRSIARDGG